MEEAEFEPGISAYKTSAFHLAYTHLIFPFAVGMIGNGFRFESQVVATTAKSQPDLYREIWVESLARV